MSSNRAWLAVFTLLLADFFDTMGTAIPAFQTVVVMPFTYSITDGIGAGFVTYTVLEYATGKGREVHWMLVFSSALFAVYFALEPIRALVSG